LGAQAPPGYGGQIRGLVGDFDQSMEAAADFAGLIPGR
jgi:hypothetical protein